MHALNADMSLSSIRSELTKYIHYDKCPCWKTLSLDFQYYNNNVGFALPQ